MQGEGQKKKTLYAGFCSPIFPLSPFGNDFTQVVGMLHYICVVWLILMEFGPSYVGGAELYEAAVKLKDLIRGRAVLLISDRTDIANAVEADGVSLTSKGALATYNE